MTGTPKTKGLIRMALMGTAFIALTIILIVFQPGSPRHTALELPEPSVTRVAPAEDSIAVAETETQAAPAVTPVVSIAAPAVVPEPPQQIGVEHQSMRELTFDAISNLKSVTTGEAPTPGEPGSLLYSVVKRSMSADPTEAATSQNEAIAETVTSTKRPIKRPTSGSYFVRPGDTLMSIALEVYGDVTMATDIFESNT